MPAYNHKCIRHLESRLMEMIEAAVELPAFQRVWESTGSNPKSIHLNAST